ncbi:unnamed protein product [Lasius platythorax]|uniref:Uncharacterized protein n=1 Tax=Lasius platythorax TaxID=488582 RepID=A0AAV2MXB8_9HYME
MTPDIVHSTTKEIAINPRTGEDIEHIAVDEPDVSVHDQPIGQDDDAGVEEATHEKRGPGRPRLIRTGGRGRPSKQYNMIQIKVRRLEMRIKTRIPPHLSQAIPTRTVGTTLSLECAQPKFRFRKL